MAASIALRYRYLVVVAFVLASLADVATTALGLRVGLHELNPFMATFLRHSELAMYAVKLLMVAMILSLCLRLERRYPLVWYSVGFWALATFLVAYSNASQSIL